MINHHSNQNGIECEPLHPELIKAIHLKIKEGRWILTETQKPKIGDNIEFSEDGIFCLGTMDYTDQRTCMLAGTSGGHGYFKEGFATDGTDRCEKGLILDAPKYWRLPN